MHVPFTENQFFEVFARYNRAIWPGQVGLLALAAAVVALILVRFRGYGRLVAAALALLWGWMALAYHFRYFATINPAAPLFTALFLFCAAAFVWFGVVRSQLKPVATHSLRSRVAYLLWFYALIGYPLLGYLVGHRYPAFPTFGVPCPTTIFTIGVLLLIPPPVPRSLFAVPVIWAAIGTVAAVQLGVPQDYGLSIAGIFGAWGCFHQPVRPKAS